MGKPDHGTTYLRVGGGLMETQSTCLLEARRPLVKDYRGTSLIRNSPPPPRTTIELKV